MDFVVPHATLSHAFVFLDGGGTVCRRYGPPCVAVVLLREALVPLAGAGLHVDHELAVHPGSCEPTYGAWVSEGPSPVIPLEPGSTCDPWHCIKRLRQQFAVPGPTCGPWRFAGRGLLETPGAELHADPQGGVRPARADLRP